jgi:hypothetical protein
MDKLKTLSRAVSVPFVGSQSRDRAGTQPQATCTSCSGGPGRGENLVKWCHPTSQKMSPPGPCPWSSFLPQNHVLLAGVAHPAPVEPLPSPQPLPPLFLFTALSPAGHCTADLTPVSPRCGYLLLGGFPFFIRFDNTLF